MFAHSLNECLESILMGILPVEFCCLFCEVNKRVGVETHYFIKSSGQR